MHHQRLCVAQCASLVEMVNCGFGILVPACGHGCDAVSLRDFRTRGAAGDEIFRDALDVGGAGFLVDWFQGDLPGCDIGQAAGCVLHTVGSRRTLQAAIGRHQRNKKCTEIA